MKNHDHSSLAKRYSTQEFAHLELYGKELRFLAKMANISRSGAFFEILNPNIKINKNDLAKITLQLKQIQKTHIIPCEIIWVRNLSVGVKFLRKKELFTKINSFLGEV